MVDTRNNQYCLPVNEDNTPPPNTENNQPDTETTNNDITPLNLNNDCLPSVTTNLFIKTTTHDGLSVISGINWDALPTTSNQQEQVEVARMLFVVKPILWKDKQFLKETAIHYGKLTGFTVGLKDIWKFCCNRLGAERKRGHGIRSPRIGGPLKVGCTWHFRISSHHKKVLPNQKKIDNFELDSPVYITSNNSSPNFIHKYPCVPSANQLIMSQRVSGNYVSKINEHTLFTLMNLMRDSPSISSSTVRTIIKPSFPRRKNITHADIFNIKAKCLRLMKQYHTHNNNNDFESFVKLYSSTEITKGLDFDSVSNDDAINLSKAIWHDVFKSDAFKNDGSSFCTLVQFMEMTKKRCNGFDYRFAIDSDGTCNGVLWMTSTMRENFIKFGSYICLDAMKRELNTFLWHYFGTALINDVGMNCLGSEGILISEREDAYKFIINSTIEMAGFHRPHDQIYCISGDGFFNQQSLEEWGCVNAKYITDYWHLFEKSLKERFGISILSLINDNLRSMANAYNEDNFDHHFNAAMQILRRKNPRDAEAENKLKEFAEEKDTYALYLIRNIRGSMKKRGSSLSEQNHFSVLSHLNNGDSSKNTYHAEPHTLFHDLINRQQKHVNKFDEALANASFSLKTIHHELTCNDNSPQFLIDASNQVISLDAYKLVKKEYEESVHYAVTRRVGQPIEVKRMNNNNALPRKFDTIDDMCSCTESISLMIQCRHKIALREKFHIGDFDYRHRFRDQCMGYMIFENNTMVNEATIEVNNSELRLGKPKDDNDYLDIVDISDSNINQSQSSVFDISEDTPVISTKSITSKESHALNVKSLRNVSNEILNKYEKIPKDVQTFISGVMIELHDLSLSGTKSNNLFENDSNINLKNTMDGFIKKYQNMFMNTSHESTFDPANTKSHFNPMNTVNHATAHMRNNPRQKRLMSNIERDSRNRKKQSIPTHDVVQEGVRKRVKNHRCCSFCQNSTHIITSCTAKNALKNMASGREINSENGKNDFLLHMRSGPRNLFSNDEHVIIQSNFFKRSNVKHILVTDSYPKKGCSPAQKNWHMYDMIFKISLIQFNGTIDRNNEHIYVPGNELENFVITSLTTKSKYIFDCIGPMPPNFDIRNKMYEASYSQRSNNDNDSSFDPPGSYNL
jgi:hypothetical protein